MFHQIEVFKNTLAYTSADITSQIIDYQKIDEDLQKAQHHAENQCRARTEIHWSPILASSTYRVRIWQWVNRCHPLPPPPSHPNANRARQLHIPLAPLSLGKIKKELYQAQKQRSKILSTSRSLRDQHLQQRADFYSQHQDLSSQQIITNIKQKETSQQLFGKIRYQIKPQNRNSVHSILVPQASGYTSITNTNSIHKHILQHTQSIFDNVRTLPISIPNFQNYLGRYGEEQGTTDILNGAPNWELCPDCPALQSLLLHLKQPKNTKNIVDPWLTESEFKKIFQRTRESTASSPSGTHVEHYKAATLVPQLCIMYANLISLPFVYGFSHHRWQKSLHAMIPKLPNAPHLHKLRIIQLIEADLNAYLKVKIGKQLMQASENTIFSVKMCMEVEETTISNRPSPRKCSSMQAITSLTPHPPPFY